MPKAIPSGVTADQVAKAIADLDAGFKTPFGAPTGFHLVQNGKRYAPKAVLGRAAFYAFGHDLGPYDFSGGEASGQANDVLRRLGFTVERIQNSRGISVSFDELEAGIAYDRKELARLWGYADWHAIGRGIVTPAGTKLIILFFTKEKQESLTQYEDHFEGDMLHMEGERRQCPER